MSIPFSSEIARVTPLDILAYKDIFRTDILISKLTWFGTVEFWRSTTFVLIVLCLRTNIVFILSTVKLSAPIAINILFLTPRVLVKGLIVVLEYLLGNCVYLRFRPYKNDKSLKKTEPYWAVLYTFHH